MSENVVSDYGWTTAEGPPSLGYIWPRIVEILRPLGVTRVLDLGAGNGALCGKLKSAGYQVTGVEFDKKGIEIARAAYPAIRFYNFEFRTIQPNCWPTRRSSMQSFRQKL